MFVAATLVDGRLYSHTDGDVLQQEIDAVMQASKVVHRRQKAVLKEHVPLQGVTGPEYNRYCRRLYNEIHQWPLESRDVIEVFHGADRVLILFWIEGE